MAADSTNIAGGPLKDLCEGLDPSPTNVRGEEPKKELDSKMEESAKIGSYMKSLLEKYEKIRGSSPKEVGVPFWDLVVISAGDESQETWYKAQLELKKESGDLPNVPYLCVADPPGPRIGSGGSTLYILTKLREEYGVDMDTWKILIIHAGGYSKRLPSHSCSGKIFSPLPIHTGKGGPYQMLDLKLAMYLPFIEIMVPGVFITCSDDIEVFNIDNLRHEGKKGESITALAHPSSLYIGTTHGVYVMKDLSLNHESLQDITTCLEVLQKPTVDLMRSRGAVIKTEKDEKVYSDSAFWFDAPLTNKLIDLYKEIGPLDVEMCIYGDLLTCLGEREDKHYISKLYSSDEEKKDIKVKKQVYQKLGKTDLSILSLHQSKFYHLGTTQEYLHGLTNDKCLRMELNLENIVCSKIEKEDDQILGIVLNSVINEAASIPQDSIVEYSIFDAKVTLGPKTILSNIHIDHDLDIPAGFLYHTIAVTINGVRKYVTVAFHNTDDMKFTSAVNSAENLLYGGKLLDKLFTAAPERFNTKTVFPDCTSASLWNAKLFFCTEINERIFQRYSGNGVISRPTGPECA
eukprot:TRINITY_DN6610_c0_g1_i8.p1 TRINITY_DN6610_c0_g1~~TRINITY_DN6610_c0_g1_i8.p1  ORF type:complete len:574 (+),score=116.90 TRINITY_DN6610_c0_g1_i8:200-1921(+)